MKKLFFITLTLFITTSTKAAFQDSIILKRINQLSTQVQKKHAPDKRTEFYELKLENADALNYTIQASRPEAIQEFKMLLKSNNLSINLKEDLLPTKDLGETIYGISNLSVINTRYAPNHAAEMATQATLGTPVKILKKEKGHYFVRTPDNYLSWTETRGIVTMNNTDFENWQVSKKLVYTDLLGFAYSEASETSSPISDLVAGNILQVLEEANGFYKVSFPDKRVAFISTKRAQLYDKWKNQSNPSADQLLKTARNFLGIPYLWGGTSVKGLDCSGFTKTSYLLHGIVLPRDASQQALVGDAVDILEKDTLNIDKALKNLLPGDHLFFAADKRTKRVTHTAIYIGNGEFIHAAGLVRINSMIGGTKNYDDFQSRTLVSARRVLTAIGDPEITRIDKHPYYQGSLSQ
jgi:gamma-D-glutamyl-L-lysine dipeptidyl-peptidase